MLQSPTDIYSSRALRLAVLTVVYICLQFAPGIGVVLGMLGGMLINWGLMAAILWLFVVECFRGPFSPRWLLVPVVGLGAFGIWYKVAFDHDQTAIRIAEAIIQERNSAPRFPFDAAQEDLVYRDQYVLGKFDIPAIYEPVGVKAPGSYFRAAIKPRHLCNVARRPDGTGEYLSGNSALSYVGAPKWCLTRLSAMPSAALVTITSRSLPAETIAGLKVQLTELAANYNGTPVAKHIDASTKVLSAFPVPFIGCFLVDAPPEWTCTAEFAHSDIKLDTVPGPDTPDSLGELGSVLAVKFRTAADFAALTAP